MAHLYIIRGITGSGKTTLADKMLRHGMVDAHFEADMFMVDESGCYNFNPKYLKFCHEQCQRVTDDALMNNQPVAVSNTFVKKWEMQAYFDIAKNHGANVTVIICQGEYSNVHGVPDEKVEDMKRRFEL